MTPEFIEWYCSEPRLSFSRTVVLRYRMHLEARKLASGTITLRLGAVRRLAFEVVDCGLLSPDLATGIRRVKGVKNCGTGRPAARPERCSQESPTSLSLRSYVTGSRALQGWLSRSRAD